MPVFWGSVSVLHVLSFPIFILPMGNTTCFRLICSVSDLRYVHNNIFFSFAVDADLGQMLKENASSVKSRCGQFAEHSANTESIPDSLEKASNSSKSGGDSNACKSEGSKVEEVSSVRDVASDVSAEPQMADSEQATYASANNDLKGTKAYQEADVPLLYNLAMAIIDYRGHRVVAQVHKRNINPLNFVSFSFLFFLGKHLGTILRVHIRFRCLLVLVKL